MINPILHYDFHHHIPAFLGIITYVIKSFVKNKELEQTSCSKNAKAVNDALNEK